MLCRPRFSMRRWLSGGSPERKALQRKRRGKLQQPAGRYPLMAAGLRLLRLLLVLKFFKATERARAPSQLDVSLPGHDVGTLLLVFGAQAVALRPRE
jgi:hypothetical protein